MPQTYKWIGMGWKSLNALILRVPLCGAKKDWKHLSLKFPQFWTSRSWVQWLLPCPASTNTSAQKSALTGSPMDLRGTCVIQTVSWPLGWRLIMGKEQKSLWKRSCSSPGQIAAGKGRKTSRYDSQINFQFRELKCFKVASYLGPLRDLPLADRKLKSSQCRDGRKSLVDSLSSRWTMETADQTYIWTSRRPLLLAFHKRKQIEENKTSLESYKSLQYWMCWNHIWNFFDRFITKFRFSSFLTISNFGSKLFWPEGYPAQSFQTERTRWLAHVPSFCELV